MDERKQENFKDTIIFNEEIKPIIPAFYKDNISICMCASNQYAPYCGITIQSIIENRSENNSYDIFVMEHDMTVKSKYLIRSLLKHTKNISIRFINMSQVINSIKLDTWAHFSVVACFKLFLMSDVFSNYDKMLLLDTDLIFEKDAADLYNTDISKYLMAAVDDVIMKMHLHNNKMMYGFAVPMPADQYISEYLGFGSPAKYYNTGVAILNLHLCRLNKLYSKAFFKLKSKGYVFQEQDVLNELCVNSILDLDIRWNVVGIELAEQIREAFSGNLLEQYELSLNDPYVIHFAGGCKPWIHKDIPYSEVFFKYAKNTPWYENILLGISFRYTYHMQNYGRSFRVKFRKFADFLFPLGSNRRELIKKILPRGSSIREKLRTTYNTIVAGNMKIKAPDFPKKIKASWHQSVYIFNLKRKLEQNFILLDSKNGTDLAGNIFRIIEELIKQDYKEYKLFLTYKKSNVDRIKKILQRYDMSMVRLVEWDSSDYYYYLARAKYIITDLYIPSQYIKRDGQILISTAHGTPLKVMGRDCHTETQGYLQRTHTLADYQTFPSTYMKEKLFYAFMEDQLFTGHALKSGYARNIVFFNNERREAVRQELKYTKKTVYAYLPTFRGIGGRFNSSAQTENVFQFCKELDDMMSDEQLLIVKMHNFNSETLDLSEFRHIQEFPDDYEVYDVLNATDVLITDYSSVFFDYANLRNKIILFQYDFSEYIRERGVYPIWDSLPFPVVNNTTELFYEMSLPKQYDDSKFLETYCTFDDPNAAKDICRTIFKQEAVCPEFEMKDSRKKNILIYAGDFKLTTASTYFVQEYLQRFDLGKNNFFIYYYEYDLFNNAHRLAVLPKEVQHISFLSYPDYTLFEKVMLKILPKGFKHKLLQKVYKRECIKCFGNLPLDLYIDINGENQIVAGIAANLSCKKAIIKSDKYSVYNCYDKYDILLSYSSELNAVQDQQQIVHLKRGYSRQIIDQNAALIEKLCDDDHIPCL